MAAAKSKPALLCVTPHFGNSLPPAGAAALLAYLHQNDCAEFGFTDFRNWLPYRVGTFSEMGAFGETFVLDVPELPVVLKMLRAYREGADTIVPDRDRMFDDYCMRRLLSPRYVHQHLTTLERFFSSAWKSYRNLKFVGFTTWTTNYLSTLIAAARLKRASPGTFIVAGGPQVTESLNSARLGLEARIFDAVVTGEGEQPLLELYRDYADNGFKPGTRHIPGVLRHSSVAQPADEKKRKLLPIKNLPAPRFDEIDLSAYKCWREDRTLPYQLSRGCTDKCTFCSEWVFWQNFRLSKPDSSVEQIEEMQQRYGMRHISFTDSLVNGVSRRLEAFAESLLSRGLDVTWGGFMRAQMTPELGELIARAGCRFAFVGVESLSDETLDSMNKRKTGIENIQAIQALANSGIPVEVGLITGFPGDNRQRFMESVRGIISLQSQFPGRVRVNVEPFRPTPNQPIYARMEEFGLEPALWDQETLDLDPFFADITSTVYCSVTGSNQGLERLGEQHYVGKVINSEPKSAQGFGVGWGSPQVLDFEHEFVKFQPFRNADLQGWYSVRALHPDGSVRFLIAADGEARALDAELEEVPYGDNPFEREPFARLWSALAAEHVIPGSIHPNKTATHVYRSDIDEMDFLQASPYWAARIVDDGDDGLIFHFLHDFAKTYRTSPVLKDTLEGLANRPRRVKDLVDKTVAAERGLARNDVAQVFASAQQLGFLSVL